MNRCSRSARASILSFCILCSAAAPVAAQARAREVPRPRLAIDADTNDAGAYYRFGEEQLRRNPATAADAFYWATRLDPTSAAPLYARRVGLLLRDPYLLVRYLDNERSALRSREVRMADSLYARALRLEPFLPRPSERLLFDGYATALVQDFQRANPNTPVGELQYFLDTWLRRASFSLRALYSYSEHDHMTALRYYGRALETSRNKSWIYAERAHIYFLAGNYPGAERELGLAIADAREHDEKDLVYFYQSQAHYEYALGYVLETARRDSAALEAYGRALQEDLSFFPAHVHTAALALARSDTAAALGSLALAAAIEGVDAGTRLQYAALLMKTGDIAEAEAQLVRLTTEEPYFARPYAVLGMAREALCRPADAMAAYSEFLARAPQADPARAAVARQLAALRQAPAGSPC